MDSLTTVTAVISMILISTTTTTTAQVCTTIMFRDPGQAFTGDLLDYSSMDNTNRPIYSSRIFSSRSIQYNQLTSRWEYLMNQQGGWNAYSDDDSLFPQDTTNWVEFVSNQLPLRNTLREVECYTPSTCSQVFVSGFTIPEFNGVYVQSQSNHDGKPTFQIASQSFGTLHLFYNDAFTRWMISQNFGSDTGYVFLGADRAATHPADTLTNGTVEWVNGQQTFPNVIFSCAASTAAPSTNTQPNSSPASTADATSTADAKSSIQASSFPTTVAPTDSVSQSCSSVILRDGVFGAYRGDVFLNSNTELNGRPVYLSVYRPDMQLSYNTFVGQWQVRYSNGAVEAFVTDSAMAPEDITGTWSSYNNLAQAIIRPALGIECYSPSSCAQVSISGFLNTALNVDFVATQQLFMGRSTFVSTNANSPLYLYFGNVSLRWMIGEDFNGFSGRAFLGLDPASHPADATTVGATDALDSSAVLSVSVTCSSSSSSAFPASSTMSLSSVASSSLSSSVVSSSQASSAVSSSQASTTPSVTSAPITSTASSSASSALPSSTESPLNPMCSPSCDASMGIMENRVMTLESIVLPMENVPAELSLLSSEVDAMQIIQNLTISTTQNDIATLEAKVETLESDLAAMTGTVQSLQTAMSQRDATIAAMQAQMAAMMETIANTCSSCSTRRAKRNTFAEINV